MGASLSATGGSLGMKGTFLVGEYLIPSYGARISSRSLISSPETQTLAIQNLHRGSLALLLHPWIENAFCQNEPVKLDAFAVKTFI